VNGVLLRPLPYRTPNRIVAIEEISAEGTRVQVTPANFLDWRAQSSVFEHLAAVLTRPANLAGVTQASRINLAVTSADFFDLFGVHPLQGRLFTTADEQAGHQPVAVLSYALWQRRFGGASDIIGQPVVLDGKTYTVIGIAPESFQYPDQTEAWLPPLRLAPEISETA